MPKIPSSTERELGSLSPSGLDENFMSRLTACAEGSSLELSEAELQFEKTLREFKPQAVPAKLHSSLAEAINDTPFAVDEKIVLFHKSSGMAVRDGKAQRSKFLRFNIAAAAAVALLGSLAAFMVPHTGGVSENTVLNKSPDGSAISSPVSSSFAPASYNRNLSDTRDEGVIWRHNNVPHRVMRFTYMDRVTLKNDKGETVEVDRPRHEYVIIPEKID